MTPRESWLALLPKEPIHENRSHMGANSRETDPDHTEGMELVHNFPLARYGRTYDGMGYLGAMHIYTF